MARSGTAIAFACALVFFASPNAHAQSPMDARLSMEKLGDIQPGTYTAGDSLEFTLDYADGNFILRIANDPEVFVLYTDHASLGGRVLKYDSGETALQVAGWGGMTLYTDANPNGLPAVRTGDAQAPSPPQVSLADMQSAADDEAQHLAYTRRLNLKFSADWSALANNDLLRARSFDALENAARGIDRLAASAAARKAIAQRIQNVLIARGDKPGISVKDKTLVTIFNPARGYQGRASSRAIAKELQRLLKIR